MAERKHQQRQKKKKKENKLKLNLKQQSISTVSLQRDVSDSELSDFEDDEMYSLQRDDKMAKSYYHFMDNYNDEAGAGGVKNQGLTQRKQQPLKNSLLDYNNTIRDDGYTNFNGNGDDDNDELSDSIFKLNYNRVDDDLNNDTTRNKSKRKGGVLGMLNQFYKQDMNRNV